VASGLGAFARRLRRIDPFTVIVALGLFGLGVIAIAEAEAFEDHDLARRAAVRQLVWGAVAALAAGAVLVPHYRSFERLAIPLWLAGVALLVTCAFIGVVRNHARRWIDLGVLLLQPSEPMKLGVILALCAVLRHAGERRLGSLALAAVLTAVPFALVARQPDLGTSLLYLPVAGVLLFLSGMRWRLVASLATALLLAVPVVYVFGLEPYQRERVTAFLEPDADPRAEGFQLHQSLLAIGTGGETGTEDRELLYSVLKYVPERESDFVFAVVGARFGFAGTAVVVVLYVLLILALARIAVRTRDCFGRLLVAGVATLLAVQAFLNLAMTVGLAPITGVPLPLMSYGGSSLLTTSVALALALNVNMRS